MRTAPSTTSSGRSTSCARTSASCRPSPTRASRTASRLETLTLVELPGGRTRLEAFSLGDSFEARDAVLASGMQEGVVEGYERLDEVLGG